MIWQGQIRAKASYVVYLIITVAASVLSFSKSIFFAKWLASADLGFYSLVMTSYVFLIYVGSFGANEYMLKLGVVAWGQKNHQKVVDIRTNALIYGTSLTLAICLSFCAIAASFNLSSLAEILIGSSVIATTAISYNIFDSYYRCTRKYLIFSSMLFCKSILVLLLSWQLIESFGVRGVIFAEAASFFLVFLTVLMVSGGEIKFSSLNKFKEEVSLMINNGMATLMVNMARNVSLVLDRYIVSVGLGLTVLGKYAFTMIIYQAAVLSGGILTNVVGPRWLSDYSEFKNPKHLVVEIKKLVLSSFFISAAFYPLFYFFLPVTLQRHFPAYADPETILISHIIYISAVIYLMTSFFDWFFIALSRERVTFIISLISLGVLCIAMGLCFLNDYGIVCYAGVFFLSRIVSFMLTGAAVFRLLKSNSTAGLDPEVR